MSSSATIETLEKSGEIAAQGIALIATFLDQYDGPVEPADGGAGGAEAVGRNLEPGQRIVPEGIETEGQQQGAGIEA